MQMIALMKVEASVYMRKVVLGQNFNIFVITFWPQSSPKLQNLPKVALSL